MEKVYVIEKGKEPMTYEEVWETYKWTIFEHIKRSQVPCMEWSDLESIYMGVLLKALKEYKIDKNTTFKTFLIKLLRQELYAMITKANLKKTGDTHYVSCLRLDIPVKNNNEHSTYGEMVLHSFATEKEITRLENQEFLDKLMCDLGDRHKQVLIMRYVDNCSFVEIAEKLGITRHYASEIAKRTLKKIKQTKADMIKNNKDLFLNYR